MESQRMTVTAAHNGGIDRFATHATRMRRRRAEPAYFTSNSKQSARRSANGAPLQTHLLQSSKSAMQTVDASTAASGVSSETWALFAHADRTDYWLMTGGVLAAITSGASLPSINIVFGTVSRLGAHSDARDPLRGLTPLVSVCACARSMQQMP